MRIAITGLGIVAPGAVGVERFRALLDEGKTAATAIDRFDTSKLRAHTAAAVRDFKARDYIHPMKMRRMNLLSRYAVAATKLAIDDAGLALPNSAGVAIGTSFGPVQTSVDYLQEYVEKGAALASPQLFAESVANAPGSHIAIEHDLRGFNVTVTQRESSALAAAMYAGSQLAKGAVTSALTGGVEELNEMVFNVLDSVGALAHQNGAVDECARPFDRRRNGFMVGEGSAILVLERKPSREPYGWLAGFGIARDTTATISDWGDDAESVVAAMRAALDDAEIAPDDVDAIYASANAGLRADRVEARAIRAMFGNDAPPVVATKGVFGEYAGAGSLQLAAALLAIHDQTLHKSVGFEETDPDLGILATGNSEPATVNHILVNAISAGGGIICAVISKEAA
jgi:3-oxoacyl-[acyl-carrier-protein] synthase II